MDYRYKIIIADMAVPKMKEEEIREDMTLAEDLGFDSLAFVNTVVALENTYGIVFDDEYINLDKLKTVGDVAEYLKEKLKK